MRKQKAFTLIEILVVLAIIATLLSIVTPRYFHSIDRSKETTLKHDLNVMREAIDKFYSDKNAYPDSLDDLVQHKYLRAIPPDPITESNATWLITPPPSIDDKGAVYDIHSGAPDIAADGTPYASW
ncbi:MAG: type II secretion system protein [Methylotenera sp.]|jgi:general secretion pathway protein G